MEKLRASDGAAGDTFGGSVAIAGNVIVVGADGDNDAGSDSGSVYVFQSLDDGTTWSEVQKLTASDAAEGDNFGDSVAVDGKLIVVGAWSESVYVFQSLDDGNWTEMQKLTASDAAAGAQFGVSVSISGSNVVVGALAPDVSSGSAYVFHSLDNGASWTEIQKLVASDGELGDRFGVSIGIDGNLIVVGAYLDSDDGFFSGSAYVFQSLDDGNWTEVEKLTASDAAAED